MRTWHSSGRPARAGGGEPPLLYCGGWWVVDGEDSVLPAFSIRHPPSTVHQLHGLAGLGGEEAPQQVPHLPGEDKILLPEELLGTRFVEVGEKDFRLGDQGGGRQLPVLLA